MPAIELTHEEQVLIDNVFSAALQRQQNSRFSAEIEKVKESLRNQKVSKEDLFPDEIKVGAALTNPSCIHVHFVEIHNHHNYGPIFDGCDVTQCTISGAGVE